VTEPRRAARVPLSLRTTLLLMMLAAALYASALPLYLFFVVRAPAFALGEGTGAIVGLEEDLAQRNRALSEAAAIARRMVDARRPPLPDTIEIIRRLVATGSTRSSAQPYARVPGRLRVALARSDEAMSNIGRGLTEVVALVELGRWDEASTRLRHVEGSSQVLDESLSTAGQLARRDLLERQEVLQTATSEVLRDTLLWLALGALLVPLAIYLVRRRIWMPLAELEAGLARVAEGDLMTQTAVRRLDEMGRLAEHFNEMTRVLRDRAEEQGRFAAAGELLAGVAHEVNNPLMAIAAHAENRVADPATSEEQRGEMLQILRQARRASKLLRGLLRFVRVTERQVARVNLNDVVRGAMDLVSYRFGVDEIAVGGQLDPKLLPVEGDDIKLEQVVVNLLSNAIDALRGVKPPRQLTVDTWVEDERVCVAVADNGRGVSPEVAARLFRPFATTKGRRGTGLGLYISRQIARDARGDLALDTTAPAGARFVLSLPAAPPEPPGLAGPSEPAEAVEAAAATAAAPATGAGSSGDGHSATARKASMAGLRLLIVDDEEAVRRPMAKFLQRRGAHVVEASDGVEALASLEGKEADVILADLRMPRMSGVALYQKLEETRPELASRVLFLSGDISQLSEPGNTPVARERVLVKPLELSELERRILEFVHREA
jgi:signal transduction histidine kinase/CheY-like chemotaxis protein